MVASLILPSFPLPLFNNLRRLQSIAVYSYLIMKLMSERPVSVCIDFRFTA